MLYLFTEDLFDEKGEIRFGSIKCHNKSAYILKDAINVILSANCTISLDGLRLELGRFGILLSRVDLCAFCTKQFSKYKEGNISIERTWEDKLCMGEECRLNFYRKKYEEGKIK